MFNNPRNEKMVTLILKWLREEIPPGEAAELELWKNESTENKAFFDAMINPESFGDDLRIMKNMDESIVDIRLKQAIGGIQAARAREKEEKTIRTQEPAHAQEREHGSEPARRAQTRPLHRLAAAAVIGLIVITALFLGHRPSGGGIGTPVIEPAMAVSGDIAPGGNRAVLTMADGRQIILDSVEIGQLGIQGNTEVRKVRNNRLSYEEEGTAPGADSSGAYPDKGTGTHPGKTSGGRPRLYNTLTTPRAGEFQVRLPDGTNVWLNNASTLRYPTSFSGSRREVELTGEAYFEVAPDARNPFIVRVSRHKGDGHGGDRQGGEGRGGSGDDGLHVEVLGTSFNIMAYPDETAIRTSLLNGSVNVSEGGKSVMLKPDQQARLDLKEADAPGSLKVEPVDTKLVVAWKDGFFNFSNSDVRTVMRQLARWYDVTVEYEGPVPENKYDGRISRDLSLSEVKKVLAASHVFFKIDGKKIIVSP